MINMLPERKFDKINLHSYTTNRFCDKISIRGSSSVFSCFDFDVNIIMHGSNILFHILMPWYCFNVWSV
jgi:hypothetical protein